MQVNDLVIGKKYIIKRTDPVKYKDHGLIVDQGDSIHITLRSKGEWNVGFTLDNDPRNIHISRPEYRERTPILECKFKVGDKVRITSNEENYTGKGIGYEFTIKEIWKGSSIFRCRENASVPKGVSQDSLELVIDPVFKIGNIVKIVKYGNSYTKDGPHSIGEYGRVTQVDYHYDHCTYIVETQYNNQRRYYASDLELYSTTPVDLIIVDGKSLPSNLQSKITITCPDDFKNISDILGEQHQKLMDNYMNNLLSSYTKPLMNTLQQEKFQNFIKKNGTKIIALSEMADEKNTELNLVGTFMSELGLNVRIMNSNLSDQYNKGDKDLVQKTFTELGDLVKILSSKEYEALTTAFDNFKKLFK